MGIYKDTKESSTGIHDEKQVQLIRYIMKVRIFGIIIVKLIVKFNPNKARLEDSIQK